MLELWMVCVLLKHVVSFSLTDLKLPTARSFWGVSSKKREAYGGQTNVTLRRPIDILVSTQCCSVSQLLTVKLTVKCQSHSYAAWNLAYVTDLAIHDDSCFIRINKTTLNENEACPYVRKCFWNAPCTLTILPVLNYAILKLSTEFSPETAFLA